MPHNQDSDRLSDDTKQKVKRKASEVRTTDITLSDCEALWLLGGSSHKPPQFGVEFISELPGGHSLIPLHDLIDVRVNLRMNIEPHHCRR